MSDFEKTVKENFIFQQSVYEHYPLLKKARELGLRVQCLDTNQKYSDEEINSALDSGTFPEWRDRKDEERDEKMFSKIRQAVNDRERKMLVLVGAAHIARGELKHKNLGDLLLQDETTKSFRVNMDRDFDTDATMQETKKKLGNEINFNSILFTALEQRGLDKVGFDLDNSILKSENAEQGNFPFDGYIKI